MPPRTPDVAGGAAEGDGASGASGGVTADNDNTGAAPGGGTGDKGRASELSSTDGILGGKRPATVVSVSGDSTSGSRPHVKIRLVDNGLTLTVPDNVVMGMAFGGRLLRVGDEICVTLVLLPGTGTYEVDGIFRD